MAQAARSRDQDKAAAPRETARAPPVSIAAPAIARSAIDGRRGTLLPARRIQPALKISSPGDPAEREAERVARQVVAMPAPVPRAGAGSGPGVQRSPLIAARAPVVPVPRPQAPAGSAAPPPKAGKPDEASPELEADVKKQLSGGRSLPKEVSSFMEPRFRANFAGVRIHTDAKAASLATRLGARAFTYGRDIFFNTGQFQPDGQEGMELIAHELTHTIQQREAIQREVAEAAPAPVEVREKSAPQVQRGIVSKALDWIADKANYIPGFRLFTIVIGVNPVNMSKVDRSGANILRALIEFIPGGGLIVEALENHGVFEKGGKFIEEQFRQLGMVGSMFRDALMEFIDSLGWRDIFRLGSLWGRAKRIFTAPIDKLIEFGKNLVSGIAEIVKDAILKPLGRYAASVVPKWDLLVGVFGKNPISDEGQSPASAIIGAFMELIGQKEIWENIQKGGAVAKAWAWFKGAMSGALALVLSIPGRVMGVIRSLTIFDIVTIVGAFKKILGAFGSFVGDFIRWAGGTILALLEIILSVVAPTMVPYLKKAGAAFNTIIKAPGTFINTLVRAGKLGFNQFKTNIVKHLTKGILDWLLGSLSGLNLYIPQSFDIRELLKFGLSVIGLTWTNVRAKLVAATNETVVKALETGFDLVVTLVRDGPAAAWKQLLENLSNLKAMVMDAIMDYVKQKVIEAAIEKLVSMLTPAGAFIQAILAIYRTITFIVNKLSQIGRLVAAFIDGLAALAAGTVAPAANRIETVLATGLSLAISFLANFAGLGNVSKKVIEIVNKIRKPVDQALDKVVKWVVDQAKKLGKMLFGKDEKPVPPAKGDKPTDGELGKTVPFTGPDGGHRIYIQTSGASAELMMASSPKPLSDHLKGFKTDASALSEPEKSKVLGAIGGAMPLAKKIEKDAKAAAKKAIGDKDRDDLDKQIEADEVTLRPMLVTILDTLAVRVPDAITPLTATFLRGPACSGPAFNAEYSAQLNRQAAQINAMSVHIWMERRKQFAVFSKQSNKTALDAKARSDARAAITDAIAERLTYPINASPKYAAVRRVAAMPGAQAIVDGIFGQFSTSTQYRGLGLATARTKAEEGMKGQAVLHEPDKVAGGRYDKITDVGQADVNSDIGANWGGWGTVPGRIHIANDLEKKIRDEMKSKKVSQAFWRKVMMKLTLVHK